MHEKKIIFAIGNPGEKYYATYHNLGLLLYDFLEKKINYSVEKFLLKKSDSFMNNSGSSLMKICNFYKINLKNNAEKLLVLHDDLTLKKYDVKLKLGGGLSGHNGLRDINKHIGPNFARIRIGIGYPENKSIDDYVLSQIDNLHEYAFTFEKASQLVLDWLNH